MPEPPAEPRVAPRIPLPQLVRRRQLPRHQAGREEFHWQRWWLVGWF